MKLHIHPYDLLLREPFSISRDTYTDRKTLIIGLEHQGMIGYGEASEHAYYQTFREDLIKASEQLRPLLLEQPFLPPGQLHEVLQPHLQDTPFLQCAFDEAAHDLCGKLAGKPLYQFWGLKPGQLPATSYTLGISSMEQLIQKVKTLPYRIYKIKLGTEQDLEIIQTLRKHTSAIFRIDANCAWDVEKTIILSEQFAKLGVEFIEQPLAADAWEEMKEVYHHSKLPVIADESCRIEEDIERCFKRFDGINIKLMKCGGITPAVRMIEKARSYGLKVMCGCMVESSVGVSAISQLLPLLDYVDMDSPLLIANDPATGPTFFPDGRIKISEEPGLGIRFTQPI